MDDENEKLIALLEEQVALLRLHRVEGWANLLEPYIERCRKFDTYGLIHVLGFAASGGMGSLNDLVISAFNGHQIDPKDEEKVNRRFCDLNRHICEQARRLLDEANSP